MINLFEQIISWFSLFFFGFFFDWLIIFVALNCNQIKFIWLVVLKKCEPKLSYILNSSICIWRHLVFQIVGRSILWSLFLRMLGRVLRLKTTTLLVFFLLSVVGNIFEKLVNNGIVDHLQYCGLFSDCQYGFRSSQLTADPLTG